MMAWLNREALAATLDTGFMHYWSRSRGKLWFKGESSGHRQQVVNWYRDCDGDTLLFTVRQTGGACHTGYESCFFQRLNRDGSPAAIEENPLFDPEAVYRERPSPMNDLPLRPTREEFLALARGRQPDPGVRRVDGRHRDAGRRLPETARRGHRRRRLRVPARIRREQRADRALLIPGQPARRDLREPRPDRHHHGAGRHPPGVPSGG